MTSVWKKMTKGKLTYEWQKPLTPVLNYVHGIEPEKYAQFLEFFFVEFVKRGYDSAASDQSARTYFLDPAKAYLPIGLNIYNEETGTHVGVDVGFNNFIYLNWLDGRGELDFHDAKIKMKDRRSYFPLDVSGAHSKGLLGYKKLFTCFNGAKQKIQVYGSCLGSPLLTVKDYGGTSVGVRKVHSYIEIRNLGGKSDRNQEIERFEAQARSQLPHFLTAYVFGAFVGHVIRSKEIKEKAHLDVARKILVDNSLDQVPELSEIVQKTIDENSSLRLR